MGNRDLAFAPHGVFRAEGEDSWIAIAVQSAEQWARLASLASIDEPTWETVEGRKHNEGALESRIEEWTSTRDVGALEQALLECGIPAHRLVSIEEFADDPQIRARGHLVRLPHSLSGFAVIEASPFNLQRTPAQYARSAPCFGRDNARILRDILRYEIAEVTELEESGVLS